MIGKQIIITTSAILLLSMAVNAQHKRLLSASVKKKSNTIQFIFTSDVHFGLSKEKFRGKTNVPSVDVNAAMIQQMNRLPGMALPNDGGVNANQPIKNIDAIAITGDIANREEKGIQSANTSWNEFLKDYQGLLKLKTSANKPIPLLVTPGNHDASNAVGFSSSYASNERWVFNDRYLQFGNAPFDQKKTVIIMITVPEKFITQSIWVLYISCL